ncbi:MAG: DUF4355 domain-containing protein [Eggerthellaceae bacterium]|nr:DUF4355 domain-containing protein [Eggerthellaceae bacterium]
MTEPNPNNAPANQNDPTPPNEPSTPSEPTRTFTQADLDSAINERLKNERKKHAQELAKYSDYEDLKAKAGKYDELEEAKKSELEKANDTAQAAIKRAEEAEAKAAALEAKAAHEALVAKVASEEDVPANLLTGADEDELRASAQALKAYIEASKPGVPQTNAGGATPAPDDEEKLSEREENAFRIR